MWRFFPPCPVWEQRCWPRSSRRHPVCSRTEITGASVACVASPPSRDVRENPGGWAGDEPVKYAWLMPSTTGVVWRSNMIPSAKRSTKPCVREAIVTAGPCDRSQTACWPSLVRCSATKRALIAVEQPPQPNCSNQPVSPGGQQMKWQQKTRRMNRSKNNLRIE